MSAYYSGIPTDDKESIAVIHAAVAAGAMLDTSDIYGPFTNEELVGEWRLDEVCTELAREWAASNPAAA